MKKSFLAIILVSCSLIVLNSCKKDEEPEPTNNTTNNTNTTPPPATTPSPQSPNPAPSDAAGSMVAVKTITYVSVPMVGVIRQDVGTGVAAFWNTPGTYLDAGAITLNTNALTKQTNNAYIFTPGTSNPSGLDFSSGNTNWSVAGNSGNSIPAINYDPAMGFPSMDTIAGGISTVTKANGVTLNMSSTITNADSVIYAVHGPSGSAIVTNANFSGYTFTGAQLSNIGSGSGYVQIASYKLTYQTVSGKKYYFINESVYTKAVTIN